MKHSWTVWRTTVHAGCIVCRRPMARAGMAIFELSPSLARQAGKLGRIAADGRSPPVLHAKPAGRGWRAQANASHADNWA